MDLITQKKNSNPQAARPNRAGHTNYFIEPAVFGGPFFALKSAIVPETVLICDSRYTCCFMATDFKSASLPSLSPSHKNGYDIQCTAYYRDMLQGMIEKMYQIEKGRAFSECEVEFV